MRYKSSRPVQIRFAACLFLGLLVQVSIHAQADKPRVIIFPTVNQGIQGEHDPVCTAAFQTITLSLRSLGTCEVISGNTAGSDWTDPSGIIQADYLVLSTVAGLPEGKLGVSVSIFSFENHSLLLHAKTPAVSLMDVFSAIDDLAADMVGTLSRKQGTFGVFEVAKVPEPTPVPSVEPVGPPVPTADSIVENAPRRLCPDGINGELMYVPYPVKISLDGNLDDWVGIPMHKTQNRLSNCIGRPVPGENESISLALAADETYLYVACTLVDKTIIVGRHGSEYYKEDSAEFYLSFGTGFNAANYNKRTLHWIISPESISLSWLINAFPSIDGADHGMEVTIFKTETGWGFEARFPLAKKIELQDGFEWGLNFQLNGASDGNGRTVKIGWSKKDPNDESWTKPSVWGKAVMYKVRDETVIPATAPAAKAEASATIPTDGLVGEWLFAGNTLDRTGNCLPFSFTDERSGAIKSRYLGPDRFGRANSALVFPYMPKENLILKNYKEKTFRGDFSVSVWFMTNGKSHYAERGRIFDVWYNHVGLNSGFGLTAGTDHNVFLEYFSPPYKSCTLGTRINDTEKWHNVIITCKTGILAIYADGIKQNEAPSGQVLIPPTRYWSIGNGYDGYASHPFLGSIDDLRIYDRALSPSEVRQLYEADSYEK